MWTFARVHWRFTDCSILISHLWRTGFSSFVLLTGFTSFCRSLRLNVSVTLPATATSVRIHCLPIILPHTLWPTGSTPGSPWYLCYRQLSVTPLPHVITITKDLAVKITGIWNACEVLWEDKWTLVCIIGSNDTHCSVLLIHDTQGEEKYHVMINQSINQSITSAERRI
jgi:hypothetical protein